jgi:hypothetical protein
MKFINFEQVKAKYHELCDKRDELDKEIQQLIIMREQLEEDILMFENMAIYQFNKMDRGEQIKNGKF